MLETITHSQLRDKLAGIKGTTFVGVLSRTDAKARKTGNPFGPIMKRARFAATVGASYGGAVNRNGNGVAEFKPQPLPWGEWDTPNKVISHKGKLYLRTQTTARQRKFVKPVVAFETEAGAPLSYSEVKPFLPEKRATKTQAKVGLETAESQVQARTFAFDSIYRVRIGGRTFRLIPG